MMERPQTADARKPESLSSEDAAIVERLRDARMRVREEMAKVVVGQESVIDHLLVGLLCRGHVLLLGVPGVGKTLMSRTLARTLDIEFRRIQFTPDLMPSDITGVDIIEEDTQTGRRKLEFLPGPVFTNFLLADEINRTPPKTQAALLQAMQEREVSIEMEGTYPLPEAQLDRFMFNLKVKYPTAAEELQIVKGTTGTRTAEARPVLKADEVIRLQDLVRGVPVADTVAAYAVRLASSTRPGESKEIEGVHKYLLYGASPRASQYLVLGAKARAILAGKYHVDFEDVKSLAGSVLRHRLVLNFHARADGVDADAVIRRLVEAVRFEG
jgi:MoxR-like ATPase